MRVPPDFEHLGLRAVSLTHLFNPHRPWKGEFDCLLGEGKSVDWRLKRLQLCLYYVAEVTEMRIGFLWKHSLGDNY